ncbi:hypothetical protein [Rhizobium sp. KDH_Rht_773_N]
MTNRRQMACASFDHVKKNGYRKKDLGFAERRVEKLSRLIVGQIAIIKWQRLNRSSVNATNALLSRTYESRRRAMNHLNLVRAFREVR